MLEKVHSRISVIPTNQHLTAGIFPRQQHGVCVLSAQLHFHLFLVDL